MQQVMIDKIAEEIRSLLEESEQEIETAMHEAAENAPPGKEFKYPISMKAVVKPEGEKGTVKVSISFSVSHKYETDEIKYGDPQTDLFKKQSDTDEVEAVKNFVDDIAVKAAKTKKPKEKTPEAEPKFKDPEIQKRYKNFMGEDTGPDEEAEGPFPEPEDSEEEVQPAFTNEDFEEQPEEAPDEPIDVSEEGEDEYPY